MSYSKTEVKTGTFVLVAVIVLLFLLFMIGAFRTTAGTYPVKVYYDFISGLEAGAPVRFAGAEVGKVEKIEILPSDHESNIQVTISVKDKVSLREDSHAYIDTLGLMGEKYVELTPGTTNTEILKRGAAIQGKDPLAMHTLYDRGMDIANKLDTTLVEMEGLFQNANSVIEDNRSEIDTVIQNLKDISEEAKVLAADLKANPWKLFWKTKEKKPADEPKKPRKKFLGIF
jgi:phospholipid/cholesterol/gamma-HCH transport system substrate-binding protein